MKKIATILFILFQLVTYAQEVVYTKIEDKDITEIPPVFPGCEEIAHSQKMNCFQKKINEHIVQNFNYPKEALKKNIQGRVNVTFLINKEGIISDVSAKGGHPLLQKEAIRIISLLPKMTPGKQKETSVISSHTVPISFKLQ